MHRELLNITEAAKYIRMSKSWLYDHSSRKHPLAPVIRIGGSLRYDPNELDIFINHLAELSRHPIGRTA